MMHYIIISDAQCVTHALEKVVRTLFIVDEGATDRKDCVHVWTIKNHFDDRLERLNRYNEMSEWIESILADGCGSQPQVIACVSVNMTRIADLNPVGCWGSASVVGMLMLTFPEIEWVLGDATQVPIFSRVAIPLGFNEPQMEEREPFKTSTLIQATTLMRAGHTPLFDGGGLRDALYSVMRVNTETEAWYLPARNHLAVAIDDERSYAQFNAYVACRFGFRGYAVSTLKLMHFLLSRDAKDAIKPELSVEDLFLNFADRDSDDHLSALDDRVDSKGKKREGRDYQFPSLLTSKLRVIASSGGGTQHERENWDKNKLYLDRMFVPLGEGLASKAANVPSGAADKGWWVKIPKPYSGVFDLFKRTKLDELITKLDDKKCVPCLSPDRSKANSEKPVSHSCSGVLLIVAERLIERAERMQDHVHDAASAVHGAVLSATACELLGCRTPTVALEALSLKQYFEALAECQFYGVQSTVDVSGRLADLEKEIDVIGECFEESHRELAVLNGKAAIVDMLVQLYREQNQFDEEQTCLCKARKLHRELHWQEKLARFSCPEGGWVQKVRCVIWGVLSLPKALMVNCSLWYLNLCLRSLFTFLLILFGWAFFWSVMCLLARHHNWSVLSSLSLSQAWEMITRYGPVALAEGAGLLFGANTLNDLGKGWLEIVNVLGVIMSFLHVGIFVSYVYSLVSRR